MIWLIPNFFNSWNQTAPVLFQTFLISPCIALFYLPKNKFKKSGIKRTVCKSIIHKKCSKLQTKQIIDLKTTKPYTWECLLCLTNKFPFAACTNQEIVVKSFNSNFNCVSHINLPSDVKEIRTNISSNIVKMILSKMAIS